MPKFETFFSGLNLQSIPNQGHCKDLAVKPHQCFKNDLNLIRCFIKLQELELERKNIVITSERN